MGDYISRKTAYQFFKDQLEEETGAYSKGRNAGLRVAMSAVMNNDAIHAADVRPRWIPVAERLPEEMDRSCGGWSAEIRPSDDVLVWLSSEKRQSVAWYSHTYNEWTTVDENTVYCFGEVTHWMPLPEPPKEELACGFC